MTSDGVSYRRATDVLSRRTARAVIAGTPRGETTILVGTAPELWEELDRPSTARQLAERLAARFHADTDVVLGDVEAALRDLESSGLVERIV